MNRRRVERERTLLADLKGGKIGKKAPGTPGKAPGTPGKGKAVVAPILEEVEEVERGRKGKPVSPIAPGTKAFMAVGGKGGDETLYGSSYAGEGVSQAEEGAGEGVEIAV